MSLHILVSSSSHESHYRLTRKGSAIKDRVLYNVSSGRSHLLTHMQGFVVYMPNLQPPRRGHGS